MNATTAPVTPIIPALPMPSFAGSFTPPEETGPPKSFLLYGDTGTQKTLSIGQLVRDGFYQKVFYLDLDNSTEIWATDDAIKDALKDGKITPVFVDPFDPGARMRMEAIILELAGMWRNPSGDILVNPNIPNFGYDLFVIDTANLMHEVALKHFMATTYNPAGTKLDNLAAYGKVAVWMDEMIRLIHNSKRFAGGFLMHAKTVEEKTGAVKVKPKLSGSFKDSIATIPSIVAYLDYEKSPAGGEAVLTATVGESDLYDSKNRYGLPAKIHDFNLSRLFATIPNNRKVSAPIVDTTAAPAAPAAPATETTPAAAAA